MPELTSPPSPPKTQARTQCDAIKKDGRRCRLTIDHVPGITKCIFHQRAEIVKNRQSNHPQSNLPSTPIKRPRGRPRKLAAKPTPENAAPSPRKRGRPRKNSAQQQFRTDRGELPIDPTRSSGLEGGPSPRQRPFFILPSAGDLKSQSLSSSNNAQVDAAALPTTTYDLRLTQSAATVSELTSLAGDSQLIHSDVAALTPSQPNPLIEQGQNQLTEHNMDEPSNA